MGGHELGRGVEGVGHVGAARVIGRGGRVRFGVRPVRGEDVVGRAAQQQIERLGEKLTDRIAGLFATERRDPAAKPEAASLVFLGADGSLQDAVKAGEYADDELAHG